MFLTRKNVYNAIVVDECKIIIYLLLVTYIGIFKDGIPELKKHVSLSLLFGSKCELSMKMHR